MKPSQPVEEIAERLRHLFLFRGWPEQDVETLAAHAAVDVRERGNDLFFQGDDCVKLHILVRGKVRMYRLQPDGHDVTLHTVSGVGLIACAALFVDGVYPASARVESAEAELIDVAGGPFLDLLGARPDLSRRIVAALAGRLTELADRLESQAADTAPVRLAKWILDLPKMPGSTMQVQVPGTKRAVALSLGMTPETFSRCLRRLEDDGLIEVDGRVIAVLDVGGLLARAEGG